VKKLAFALITVILFLSCYDEKLLVINNESSYVVTFNLTTGYRTADYTLEAGKQFTHTMIDSHNHSINSYEPEDNVTFSRDGDTYTFINTPLSEPIPAFIFNTLKKVVILSGNGAISTDPLTIEENDEIFTETIIKKDPTFSAKTADGYPVQVDFILDETGYKIILR